MVKAGQWQEDRKLPYKWTKVRAVVSLYATDTEVDDIFYTQKFR